MHAPVKKPTLRFEPAITRPSVRSLVRACCAAAIAALERIPPPPAKVARREWQSDDGAEWLLRAASEPAMMATAPGLVQMWMVDFVATLTGQSAAASLFRDALQLSFGRSGRINVPTLLGDASLAAFVAEGYPIPVVQPLIQPLVALVPYKLATIVVMTTEMVRSSNIEALVNDALKRAVSLALDKVLFDANNADASRPTGLRYGITALVASTAPDATDALLMDVEALHEDIEDVTPRSPVYIASPTRALMMELKSPHSLDPLKLYGSTALHNTDDVIAVAAPAVAVAYGDTPDITASRESALQMDTAPVSETLTGRTSSTWQADLVAIKVRLPVSWALRSSIGCAWLTATNW
jgi:hypothetical protein